MTSMGLFLIRLDG
uniref:Uncharacterized protein n=1 Tax=Rhizophora mucronata TaxID=61149 RepID=A0A2P2P149_RHIMU